MWTTLGLFCLSDTQVWVPGQLPGWPRGLGSTGMQVADEAVRQGDISRE